MHEGIRSASRSSPGRRHAVATQDRKQTQTRVYAHARTHEDTKSKPQDSAAASTPEFIFGEDSKQPQTTTSSPFSNDEYASRCFHVTPEYFGYHCVFFLRASDAYFGGSSRYTPVVFPSTLQLNFPDALTTCPVSSFHFYCYFSGAAASLARRSGYQLIGLPCYEFMQTPTIAWA